jgi:alpha-L-arabinofuranosidase
MTRKPNLTSILLVLSCIALQGLAQTTPVITVKANEIKATVQPTMYGIFFEDINFGADGGIYAELVKNRSFEFYRPLMGWREIKPQNSQDAVQFIIRGENESNPRYARFKVRSASGYGISNEGFRGMGIKQNNQYEFSVLARVQEGSGNRLRIELVDSKNAKIGEASLPISGANWTKHRVSITATGADPKSKMNLFFEGTGVVDLDMISLFPKDTWKNRPGGLRADLVQLLADMKPGFIRFPGGCIVEGHELDNRYQWKKTVGDVDSREMIVNRWNTEFRHRPAPDYYQSFGLGFYEYFLLAEDIGAEPLPILNCGMACQFNTAELVPMDQLDPYVQDALDLIEFANGPVSSKWGKLRADMGHPQPFNMKLIGVGNEQWGEQYVERYKVFQDAIRAKYPDVKIVSSVGPSPDGELFEFLNPRIRGLKADIIDEHYYKPPEWFKENARRYDNYDRNGPKIFAGEYAAQSRAIASPDNRNNWQCALSEAAFMTGLERNADVVTMTSYAPLFAHTDAWQWTPDLIWFDNLRSYGTPNYYVQKLFSTNRGTHVVPMLLGNEPITGQNGLFATATIDKGTNELIIKMVNTTGTSATHAVNVTGVKKFDKKAKVTVLQSTDMNAVNSLDQPKALSPADTEMDVSGKKLNITTAPNSFTVVRVKML